MAASRGPAEPYVTQFEATVASIDGADVRLSGTYFYPKGGGQPADRGTIDGIPVREVTERDGTVVHTLESAPTFAEGDTITAVIDDAFRTYTMRAHTASHVLYGAGRVLFDDIGYGGFDISEEKVRVDFDTSTEVDDELLVELERLTNRAVWDAREVTWEERPSEEVTASEEISFNAATEEGVLASADSIRVVTVDGWDAAVCGGTHVSNTREIGPVTVLDRSNPGGELTRVTFAVGPPGIERRATEKNAILDTTTTLGTNVQSLADDIKRLKEERNRFENELESYRRQALEEELRDLDTIGSWTVGAVGAYDSNDVGEQAKSLVSEERPVVAVTGGKENPFVVVATDGSTDAGSIVNAVTDEFGGGGGGGQSFAQGGGFSADVEDVERFLLGYAEDRS